MTKRTLAVSNPYSGEVTLLSDEEYTLYYKIKRAEEKEDYDTVQKGLSKFSKMNPDAYMILLD